MRKTGLAMSAILLLIAIPVFAAGAHNITLAGTGSMSVSGMATVISGDVGGSNPFHNVEVNIRMDKAPASGQVYEAWAIDSSDKVYRSLGAFNGATFHSNSRFTHWSDTGPFDTLAVSLDQAHSTCAAPVTTVAQGVLPGTSLSAADFRSLAVLPDDEAFQRTMIAQSTGLSADQIINYRMMALTYPQIGLAANAAKRCNKSVDDVVAMLNQGNTWDQIATTCNTTVAMLTEPALTPVPAMPSSIGAASLPSMAGPNYYLRYPSGKAVVTAGDWIRLNASGYTWREVAVAANISAITGESVDDILRMVSVQGMTFPQIAMDRGISYSRVSDVSKWPFGEAAVPYGMPSTPSSTGSSNMPSDTGTYNY